MGRPFFGHTECEVARTTASLVPGRHSLVVEPGDVRFQRFDVPPDAVGRGEWRLLPVLSGLDDKTGHDLFVLLHLPLFALLIACCWSSGQAVRRWSRLLVAAFLVSRERLANARAHAIPQLHGNQSPARV